MSKILTRFVQSPRPPENTNVFWIKDTDDEFSLNAYGDDGWEPIGMARSELLKIVAQLQEEVKANTNILGGITHDAAAPTPGRSGSYEFTSAGVCSWLDGTSVAIGDRAIVVYNTTYTYTYQENTNTNTNIEQVRSQTTNKVPSSKLLDDELNEKFDKTSLESARSQSTTTVPTSKLLDDELTALNTEIETKVSLLEDELMTLNTKIETEASELLAATVYISANEYQTLIDNELVNPDVEYNIYEE